MMYQSPHYSHIQHEYNDDCSCWREIVNGVAGEWRENRDKPDVVISNYYVAGWIRLASTSV